MNPASRKTLRKKLEQLIRDIADPAQSPDVDSSLVALGCAHAADTFEQIAVRLGDAPDRLASLMLDLIESPHPQSALVNFLRYLEVSGASDAFLETMAAGKPLREILATIFGSSQYMSDIIIRNPGYLYWLLEQSTWDAPDTAEFFLGELELEAANFLSLEEKLNAVRRYHRRILLKVGVNDLLGHTQVDATAAVLSNLADAIVRAIIGLLWPGTVGETPPPTGFTVIAMGKLGGRELNYSSDIDLIYLCDDADDERYARLSKLSRELTRALSDVTREGYLYRTDLRLRPDGEVGPIVNSLTGMRVYYENRGRPWEFQAMLKARVMAGDAELGSHFLDHISGLIFNPSLSYSPVDAISLMRSRIRENISSKERSFNIKLMEGGIRDIEFIVQTLQLLYGNKQTSLRTTNTLAGLGAARKAGLISDVEEKTLSSAYRFFRQVEHRLQMMHQIKTHSIPDSEEEIERLARRVGRGPMGQIDRLQFLERLTSHLNQVRLLSDSFFSGTEVSEAATLLLLPAGDSDAADLLRRHGIKDPKRALSIIQSLAYGTFPDLVDRNTRASFQKLLPGLLSYFERAGDPDRAWINFANLAAAVRNVSPFYDFLSESRMARGSILTMAAASALLTSKLCANIDAFDSLLEDPRSVIDVEFANELTWKTLTEGGGEPRALQQKLSRTIDTRILAGWMLDHAAASFPGEMSRAISATTRRVTASAFDTMLENLTGIAILALGSFAVGEPRISSDVDLLVVTRERDHEPIIRRIHALNQTLSQSSGLKLDFRLRGEGANAPLVQDLAFYESYFERRMSVWERIAFAKCALWRGDLALADDFLAMLRPHLIRPLTRADADAVLDTRKKLERLVPKEAALFETKRCTGGRYDIEYLTWIGLVLGGCDFDPGITTVDRISMITSAGIIDADDATALNEAITTYNLVDYIMDLQALSAPKNDAARTELAVYIDKTLDLLDKPVPGGIERALTSHKKAVRACYAAVGKKLLSTVA